MPSFLEWDMTSKRLGSTVFPAAMVFVVALMVIPMPAPVLDVLLTLNIAFAVLILLAAIGASRALDLSAFPSLLLIATLFRLGLNVPRPDSSWVRGPPAQSSRRSGTSSSRDRSSLDLWCSSSSSSSSSSW